jgi:hypothetical protein
MLCSQFCRRHVPPSSTTSNTLDDNCGPAKSESSACRRWRSRRVREKNVRFNPPGPSPKQAARTRRPCNSRLVSFDAIEVYFTPSGFSSVERENWPSPYTGLCSEKDGTKRSDPITKGVTGPPQTCLGGGKLFCHEKTVVFLLCAVVDHACPLWRRYLGRRPESWQGVFLSPFRI